MSKTFSAILGRLVGGLTAPLGTWSRRATLARLSGDLVPVVDADTAAGPVRFYCPTKSSLYWPRGAYGDEPATVAWLDGFADGDVLWDIGACVGVFALYAAKRGHRVFAFEANPYSYGCLVRNVALNGLEDRLRPFCLALDDTAGSATFHLSSDEAGSVANTIDGDTAGRVVGATAQAEVTVLKASVDHLVAAFGLTPPTHIKIDVDSIEDRILDGAVQTLRGPSVRSVLVELGTHDDAQRAQAARIGTLMESLGFRPTVTVPEALYYNQIFVR